MDTCRVPVASRQLPNGFRVYNSSFAALAAFPALGCVLASAGHPRPTELPHSPQASTRQLSAWLHATQTAGDAATSPKPSTNLHPYH